MSTRRALFFSFLDRYAALVLSIVSSMFIARLLTPAEIGVFSVTMVFIMFISSMRDLGAGQYLVQEKELTPERIRATWTVLLGTGLFMALVVLAAAYPVAHFYNEPRMVEIMWVIAINFAVNPFGSMTYAWLMREMRFDALATMRFGGSLAGTCTSVFLAWKGHGPISLAYGNLLSTLVNAAISLRYRPENFAWLPGFKDVRRVIGFGSKISATSLIWNIASGAPELFLGKLQNLAAAGMYSRGNGLAQMFQRMILDATQAVALPMFAKAQREVGNISEPLLRALSYVTALGWSFFLGLALMGFPLTRLLYGNQWDDSVSLMRLLAIGMAIGLPAAMCPSALMATGYASRILGISLVVVPIQVLCVGLGAMISLEGAGIGFVVSQVCTVPIWLIVTQREIKFEWQSLVRVLARSAGVAFVVTLAPISSVVFYGLQPQSSVAPLVLAGSVGLALFWVAARWLRHPIQDEIDRVTTQLQRRWRKHLSA
jgi:O-antigen/teichoic acid export membrane protein